MSVFLAPSLPRSLPPSSSIDFTFSLSISFSLSHSRSLLDGLLSTKDRNYKNNTHVEVRVIQQTWVSHGETSPDLSAPQHRNLSSSRPIRNESLRSALTNHRLVRFPCVNQSGTQWIHRRKRKRLSFGQEVPFTSCQSVNSVSTCKQKSQVVNKWARCQQGSALSTFFCFFALVNISVFHVSQNLNDLGATT